MSQPLTNTQKFKIGADLENFHRYCGSVQGSLPLEDSDDWNRLALAWLAWTAYQDSSNESQ